MATAPPTKSAPATVTNPNLIGFETIVDRPAEIKKSGAGEFNHSAS